MDAGHLSATIERIYAAGTAAESWHDALSAVYALVGATGGGIIRTDAAGSRAIMASMLEPGAVTEYVDHYAPLDHVVAEVEAGPIGVPLSGADLIWPHTDTEFYADWVRRNGMGDGIFVRVDRSTTFVCAHERRDDPFATRERIAAVALLSPHLRRAIAIGARTVGLGELDPSLPSALDAVDRAVCWCCAPTPRSSSRTRPHTCSSARPTGCASIRQADSSPPRAPTASSAPPSTRPPPRTASDAARVW
ncbi:hypothetical protein [Gordonia polyisoprenivorans]|uniref:hypothetical protein n=1 Tax=Gordonia polyisoprenivorans TaxID=84595 RepID=UPI0030D48D3C